MARLILFALLLLFSALPIASAGVVDTFQYHPSNDPTQCNVNETFCTKWEGVGTNPAISLVEPNASEHNLVMYKRVGSNTWGGPYEGYVKALDNVSAYQVSLILKTTYSDAGGTLTFYSGYPKIRIYNLTGGSYADYQYVQDGETAGVYRLYEFTVLGDNMLYVRVNGKYEGAFFTFNGPIGRIEIHSKFGWSGGTAAGGWSYTYIDDVTYSNAIVDVSHDHQGMNLYTHNIADSFYQPLPSFLLQVNYTLAYSNYDESSYTLYVKRLSDGAIISTQTLKSAGTTYVTQPPFGKVTYPDLRTLFGTNYGFYVFYIKRNDIYLDENYVFWYLHDPESNHWIDAEDVRSGETSIVNYNIQPYEGTYSYSVKIYDSTFTLKTSQTITASSGTVNIDTTDLDGGSYYAVLSSSVGDLAYDVFTVTPEVNIEGYTYNAETGELLGNVNVSITQSTIKYNTTSNNTGYYNYSALEKNVPIYVNATKTNFTHVDFNFTPLAYGTYTVNLYLWPSNISRSTTAIHGQVLSYPLYQAVSNARVDITNSSWSNNNLTNSIGYFLYDNLSVDTYTLWGSKTNYKNSSNYSVTTQSNIWSIQNIVIHPVYTLTVRVIDSTTLALISGVNVTADSSTSGTNPAVFNLEYGSYTVTATASGYYSNAKVVLLQSDTTIEIKLIKIGAEAQQQITYQGAPHFVKFLVVDRYWSPITGATVTAQGYNTTMGGWNWLKGLLGINYAEYPLHNASMSGITGSDGIVTFLMVETIYYNVQVTKASQGIDYSDYWLYPKDDYYPIVVPSNETVWSRYAVEVKDAVFVNISKSIVNSTHAYINATYLDKLNQTSSLKIYVNQSIQGDMTNQTVVSSWTGSGNLNNTAHNFSVSGYSGQSYFVHIQAQHSIYGKIDKYYAVNFEKAVEVPGVPTQFWLWLAVSVTFFLGAVFTYRTAEQGALLICILSWIFLAIGAYDSVNKVQMGIGLTFATVISIFALFKKHTREEGYS